MAVGDVFVTIVIAHDAALVFGIIHAVDIALEGAALHTGVVGGVAHDAPHVEVVAGELAQVDYSIIDVDVAHHTVAFDRAEEAGITGDGGGVVDVEAVDGVALAVEGAQELAVLERAFATDRHPRMGAGGVGHHVVVEHDVVVEDDVLALVVVVAPVNHVGEVGQLLSGVDDVRVGSRTVTASKHLRRGRAGHSPRLGAAAHLRHGEDCEHSYRNPTDKCFHKPNVSMFIVKEILYNVLFAKVASSCQLCK